ncbi:MAG: imidazole glycerol phosphate synthase subunit HisH [Pirellulales bacterium]
MLAIIDYQMGNLRSVQKAFENVGHPACVTSDAGDIRAADKIVLPGVGAFKDAISELKRRDLVPPILAAIESGKPVLGICLGLQLLFDVSEEDGQHEGLGVIPGRVVRFRPGEGLATPAGSASGALSAREPTSDVPTTVEGLTDSPESPQLGAASRPALKVPHMGWNQLRIRRPAPILAGIPDGSHFYFVHSYYVAPAADRVIATETDYGISFCSMIWRDNLYAVQFHPEKSQRIGLKMLKNFAELGAS